MATDLKVQFFSHLNGINLGNNWGDLIRMLDTCLVNGLPFTSVTAASIDANGDINLTFFAAHNAVLFQIVELTGFSPSNINGKYRIKGLPTSTQMILKAELSGQSITANGSAKLAALGYEIIFRDANDVKRVYRAKNPTSAHPFIRVDESISDGANSYNSTYAKSAMVGLIENMTSIDDYLDSNKLQLPLDTSNFKKNWQITGTGTSVVRGRSKLYWAMGSQGYSTANETTMTSLGASPYPFTLCGDMDAIYLINNVTVFSSNMNNKSLKGFGLFNSSLPSDVIPNWFLALPDRSDIQAGASYTLYTTGGMPAHYSAAASRIQMPKYSVLSRVSNTVEVTPLVPDYDSGRSNLFGSSNVGALEIPLYDSDSFLRGTLKHVFYSGNNRGIISTTAILSEKSMYVCDNTYGAGGGSANVYFYLGELE